jgi:hypothetical protein
VTPVTRKVPLGAGMNATRPDTVSCPWFCCLRGFISSQDVFESNDRRSCDQRCTLLSQLSYTPRKIKRKVGESNPQPIIGRLVSNQLPEFAKPSKLSISVERLIQVTVQQTCTVAPIPSCNMPLAMPTLHAVSPIVDPPRVERGSPPRQAGVFPLDHGPVLSSGPPRT